MINHGNDDLGDIQFHPALMMIQWQCMRRSPIVCSARKRRSYLLALLVLVIANDVIFLPYSGSTNTMEEEIRRSFLKYVKSRRGLLLSA